jgi:hypothetical protein
MAPLDDPYRLNVNWDETTQMSWIIRRPLDETIHNYKASGNLGFDTVNRRWPKRPIDKSGFLTAFVAEQEVEVLTKSNWENYAGILLRPVEDESFEQVWEKDGEAQFYVGSEQVRYGRMVMPDPNPQYADEGTDVVQQFLTKTFTFVAKTTITAAIIAGAGYAAGVKVIQVDTVSANYGLQVGDTIKIGSTYFGLIEKIVYATATTATITLAFGLQAAVAGAAAVTTAHAADAPIFFPRYLDLFGNVKELLNAKLLTESTGTIACAFQAIETVVPPVAGVSIVPASYGGLSKAGGIGVYVHTALVAGNVLELVAHFFDDLVRPWTVGRAGTSGAARVSATSATRVDVEIKT